jgi:hypothetical protein
MRTSQRNGIYTQDTKYGEGRARSECVCACNIHDYIAPLNNNNNMGVNKILCKLFVCLCCLAVDIRMYIYFYKILYIIFFLSFFLVWKHHDYVYIGRERDRSKKSQVLSWVPLLPMSTHSSPFSACKRLKKNKKCRVQSVYMLFISRAIPASPKKVCSWELANHDGRVPRIASKYYLLAEYTACIEASVAFAGWLHSLVYWMKIQF